MHLYQHCSLIRITLLSDTPAPGTWLPPRNHVGGHWPHSFQMHQTKCVTVSGECQILKARIKLVWKKHPKRESPPPVFALFAKGGCLSVP